MREAKKFNASPLMDPRAKATSGRCAIQDESATNTAYTPKFSIPPKAFVNKKVSH